MSMSIVWMLCASCDKNDILTNISRIKYVFRQCHYASDSLRLQAIE
jgi:hypothetical protein